MNEFIDFPCPICFKQSGKVYLESTLSSNQVVFGYKWTPQVREHYRYLKCDECKHVWASPRPSDLYGSYIETKDDTYLSTSELRRETSVKVIRILRKYIGNGNKNKHKPRILDVGCSTGDFLLEAQKDFEVEGVELSSWAVDIARSHDLKVFTQNIETLDVSKTKYDCISMWGVIEHLENPYDAIDNLSKFLNQDGIVAIWTGNVFSVPSKIFRENWWYIMGQHINLFSQTSLDKIMSANGLARVTKRIYPYVITMNYLGESMKRYKFLSTLTQFLQSKIVRDLKIVLYLPGEMFSIYRKI
jgi:2-polyprenyl-3-methyl-5-hydroxy-6-metoxy-1,4-benzoquinol methylase